jgi:catechol 2,3-dioxygenase
LAKVLRKLVDNKYPLDGAADHGVSEAFYLQDPDGNGVELYVDRPRKEWKVKNDGEVEMVTEPLDLNDLLRLI